MGGILSSLADNSVFLIEGAIEEFQGPLFSEEESALEHALPKRRREFTAGRICAHLALRQAGIPDFPVISRSDRTPVWPCGIAGSISHTHDYCAAAVTRKFRGIGLDVERIDRFHQELARHVCTEHEKTELLKSMHPDKFLAVLFCLKEALFKAWYPLTGIWLEFNDADISFDLFSGYAGIIINKSTGYDLKLSGRYVINRDHAGAIVTAE
ncbi:MAG: hypothetical protein A2096_16005 [Spirochaetes bacterium GWF1_41_5]|nr:MAG: hypothetical protein A2096_16005 [Spirochaetes bacterium GWF1_41_5]HBE04122.1 4-phosphopantetheinyl transferase [Spirochaetia bacterium]